MVETLKAWWARLYQLPLGKSLFTKLVSLLIPYTGSVSPKVLQVSAGYAKVSIADRRRVRNHLGSIHALALANLGEFTTGLAIHFAMKQNTRAILTRLSTDFFKKARGTITAEASVDLPSDHEEGSVVVDASLFDDRGNLVAKVSATWLVGKTGRSQHLENLASISRN